jgi:hypothetical protein
VQQVLREKLVLLDHKEKVVLREHKVFKET